MTADPTPDHAADLASLAGRTIVEASWRDPSEDNAWSDHGEFTLTLDDGRRVIFDSTGYDASDVHMRIEPGTRT